jgi:hypothetical protein
LSQNPSRVRTRTASMRWRRRAGRTPAMRRTRARRARLPQRRPRPTPLWRTRRSPSLPPPLPPPPPLLSLARTTPFRTCILHRCSTPTPPI